MYRDLFYNKDDCCLLVLNENSLHDFILYNHAESLLINSLENLSLEINPFHTGADAGENFVWDCSQKIAQHGYRKVLSEDFHRISFLAVNVCNVNHTDIHTDIAHVRCFLSVYQTISVSATQFAVQSVGITDR